MPACFVPILSDSPKSSLTWEIEVRDEATWGGFEIIAVTDATHLQLEQTALSQSGVDYEIIRAETFDGTEVSELWPDATADLNSSSNNVIIESGSKLESHGGTLIASSGSLLGWS